MNKYEYVIEWSENQQAFHVIETVEMLKNNARAFASFRHSDWMPILFCESRERAGELVVELRNAREGKANQSQNATVPQSNSSGNEHLAP